MKQKLTALVTVAVIVIVGLCWWYTSPVPTEKLTGVDWSQCTRIDGDFSVYAADGSVSGYTLSLTEGDELFEPYFHVSKTSTLSRSITNLISGGEVELPQPNPGDAVITVTCHLGGEALMYRTTGADVTLTLGGRGWHGTLGNMEVWLSTVTQGLVAEGVPFGVE